MIRPAAALPLLAWLASCAPEHGAAFERAMAEADRAETSGRYADSARGFDEAARVALLARDRAHAAYLAALMLDRAGDPAAARPRLHALATASPPLEDSAAAAYREADMDLRAGDARGWDELEAMLLRFPDDGLGKPALHRLLAHAEEEGAGAAGGLALLRALAPALASTERAEEVAYESASLLAETGAIAAARDAFVTTAARWRYPVGALWDDALYRAAELDRRLGRPTLALADLDAMLSQQESAILSGSATRPRFPAAAMLAAEIARDDLHDAPRARALFHAAYARFPTWEDRDKALWAEAELSRREGRTSEECATLSTLAAELPDSRYAPCAADRCPGVTLARREGAAPRACHEYIERDAPR